MEMSVMSLNHTLSNIGNSGRSASTLSNFLFFLLKNAPTITLKLKHLRSVSLTTLLLKNRSCLWYEPTSKLLRIQ